MPVQYDSKKIIPAPLVRVEKNYNRTQSGQKVGSTFTLTITGTLVTCNGSPNSAGEFWTLAGYPDALFQSNVEEGNSVNQMQFLIRKMQALRDLFSQDGKSFEVQPLDGTAPMRCYPRVQNISFNEGVWVNRVDYTITLEADELFGIDTDFMKDEEDFEHDQDFFKGADNEKLYLSDVSESWTIETNEEPENENNPYTFRLSHSLSATGKKAYNGDGLVSEAWEQAKRWVVPRLGVDGAFVNGTPGMNLSGMTAFNHVKQENIDKTNGTYGVTETWILSKGNFREDFNISISSSSESPFANVKLEGEIIGLETRNAADVITTSRWSAAQTRYLALHPTGFYNRAQLYSGITLNTVLLSSSVAENPVTGRINYTFEYDNRPSNCIAGAISEKVVVQDTNPADVFAIIQVIGRGTGPVLQSMGTVTERRRTVSVEALFAPVSTCFTTVNGVASLMGSSPYTAVDAVFAAFRAQLAQGYNQVFTERDEPSWEPKTGRYSRSVTWVYQNCS
jgi:hypothetical protein